jgi:hypothetical protein
LSEAGTSQPVVQSFGVSLKKGPNRRILADSWDQGGKDALNMVYTKELKDQNLEAREEVSTNAPSLLVNEMEITVFVDSDHMHDQGTRKLITSIIIFVGRTPMI